jgi:sugar/nucleoside kinase (ribokinase family)/D-arabinose 5-phosphate isomerase GutQ
MRFCQLLQQSLPRPQRAARALASLAGASQIVVGCGSNVVDKFFRVRAIPKPGEKGYFANPKKHLESEVVGGVTLNHLAWARVLGVPTALFALQGEDEVGRTIRAEMQRQGVSTQYVQVSEAYASSVSYVWLEPSGERCILMAPASTGEVSESIVEAKMKPAIERAAIVSTEVSQVPLSAVETILKLANSFGRISVLDVDVPPSVSRDAAGLGSHDELLACVRAAQVLKPSLEAARELLELWGSDAAKANLGKVRAEEIARRLRDTFDCKLVAVTNGAAGAGLAISSAATLVPPLPGVRVVDATGAGDAFMGGLIAALYHKGVPTDLSSLTLAGRVASAAGATCVQSLGALPDPTGSSLASVRRFVPEFDFPALPTERAAAKAHSSSEAFAHSLAQDELALACLIEAFKKSTHVAAFVAALGPSSGGRIFTTGIGKSAHVAHRFAAGLSSLSVSAEFVHGAEWAHGDLGKVRGGDRIVCFSHSGRTPELLDACRHLKQRGAVLFAVVGDGGSELARACNHALSVPLVPPAEEFLKRVPTRSVVLQEVVANALIAAVAPPNAAEVFKANHPGGAIGKDARAA